MPSSAPYSCLLSRHGRCRAVSVPISRLLSPLPFWEQFPEDPSSGLSGPYLLLGRPPCRLGMSLCCSRAAPAASSSQAQTDGWPAELTPAQQQEVAELPRVAFHKWSLCLLGPHRRDRWWRVAWDGPSPLHVDLEPWPRPCRVVTGDGDPLLGSNRETQWTHRQLTLYSSLWPLCSLTHPDTTRPFCS